MNILKVIVETFSCCPFRRWLVIGLIVGGLTWSGCNRVGLIEADAYALTQAAYSAALAKSEIRIAQIEYLMNDSENPINLSASERRWLTQIIELSHRGKWDAAAQAARNVLEAQVKSDR